jgi:hypothetical protein
MSGRSELSVRQIGERAAAAKEDLQDLKKIHFASKSH